MFSILKILWNRVLINRALCLRKAFCFFNTIVALLAYIGLFLPTTEYFKEWCGGNLCHKILVIISISVFAYIIICIVYLIIILKTKKMPIIEFKEGHSLYVCYGDLFQPNNKQKRKIVIPVNRYFDTIVDDHLIAKKSIHGQLFSKFYECKQHNPNTLNNLIQKHLPKDALTDRVNKEQKSKGNLIKYPVGTIAEIECNNNDYILLGLTEFDKNLSAHISLEDFAVAISGLVNYCSTMSQGIPLYLPVIGSGLAKIYSSEIDILKYIIATFALYRSRIHNDIYIVIRDNAKSEISISNICCYYL